VTKLPIYESGNADEGKIAARFAGDESSERHLGGIELLVHAHAPMYFRGSIDRDEIDLHAFGTDSAVFERPNDVIVAATEIEG
jgi:hypothetical protein